MSIKNTLKSIKLNESTLSLIIGVLVILVVGVLVVRYFRSIDESETLPPITTEAESEPGTTSTDPEGRKVYTVATGDSLWVIAQKQYGDGAKWILIAQANDLTSPGGIEEGQDLVLPEDEEAEDSDLAQLTETEDSEEETEAEEATPEPEATSEPELISEEAETDEEEVVETEIKGESYIVVKGDNLWTIAIRAYGDGTKWTEIAEVNNLDNPHLIHAGNEFVLPR